MREFIIFLIAFSIPSKCQSKCFHAIDNIVRYILLHTLSLWFFKPIIVCDTMKTTHKYFVKYNIILCLSVRVYRTIIINDGFLDTRRDLGGPSLWTIVLVPKVAGYDNNFFFSIFAIYSYNLIILEIISNMIKIRRKNGGKVLC